MTLKLVNDELTSFLAYTKVPNLPIFPKHLEDISGDPDDEVKFLIKTSISMDEEINFLMEISPAKKQRYN